MVFALRVLFRASKCDVVYVQRTPLPPAYFDLLASVTGDIVYDFDDALYAAPPWEGTVDETRKATLNRTLEKASVVIAGSPVLEEYAARYADRTYCLTTSLPREEYERAGAGRASENGGTDEDERITIGWIGYPANLRYLAPIEGAIAAVLDEHPNARLHVITGEETPVAPLRGREDVSYRTWSPRAELDFLGEIDVGINPLPDDSWARGKGGYTSVVQMMALGIPVVVTPLSMLAEIVTHGESGFHASTDAEWIEHVSTLVEDADRRDSMGEAAFQTVGERGLWTESYAEGLLEVFRSIEDDCSSIRRERQPLARLRGIVQR
jgi:glycosyltransferase involved in cell wall biosynthesis